MRNIVFAWLLLAICLVGSLKVCAQAPLIYGVIFDKEVPKKISSLSPGGPGEKAGLESGDLVRSVNSVSTAGLDNDAIRGMLAKQSEASVTIERAGSMKTVHMSKAPMDSFGRICVSGNCETGQGRLRMVNYAGREYEGQFENGSPKGETKIYNQAGALFYKGFVKDFLANGNGKVYAADKTGNTVVTEEGDYRNGYLVNGIVYNDDGTLQSSGQYAEAYPRKLISVARTTVYRGKACNIFCEKITRGPNGPIYNGKVRIRELEGDNPDARMLLEINYLNGIPNGIAKAWDYDNGVYHFMQYQNGVLREDGLNGGMIMRISDNVPIASEVRYSSDATSTCNWFNRIAHGVFHFGSTFLEINNPSGGGSLAAMKQLYASKTGQEVGLNVVKTTTDNNNKEEIIVPPGHTRDEVRQAIQACAMMAKYNETQIQRLETIARGIHRSNYTNARRNFESLQLQIVTTYDNALSKYKGILPEKLYNLLESKRNRINNLEVPSYVQY